MLMTGREPKKVCRVSHRVVPIVIIVRTLSKLSQSNLVFSKILKMIEMSRLKMIYFLGKVASLERIEEQLEAKSERLIRV